MANFTNTSTQTGFDAQSFAQSVSGARNATREASSAKGKGFFNFGGYSVVGINTNQIPAMRTAIRAYVQRIEDHLDNIKVTTDPSVALKGTGMEDAVKQYITAVVEYCKALTSNLLAFSDKLAKVEEAWRTSDANMANKVNNSTGDLTGNSQTYTEQFTN